MRLVDADKLEDVLAKHQTHYYGDSDYYEGISQGFNLAIYDVKETPTIDAEPVSHGKWIHQEYKGIKYQNIGYYVCSECGYVVFGMDKMNRYCSYCGAKMEGEEE